MDRVYGLSLWIESEESGVKKWKKNTLQGVKNLKDGEKLNQNFKKYRKYEEEVTWLTKGRRKRLHHVTSSKEEKSDL